MLPNKLSLLFSIGAVILAIAVLAGLASRRRALPGRALIVVLSVAGLAAVIFSPVFAPLNLLAPVVALSTGLDAFSWLYALASRPRGATTGTVGGTPRRAPLRSPVQ